MSTKRVRVIVMVDVVGALATENLDGALWLVDSNKSGGSTREGTSQLKTAVKKGDELIWTVMSLECEAFAAIESIEIDPAYCEVTRGVYEGTDISFWLGKVKKDPGSSVIPYNVHVRLGTRAGFMPLSGPSFPALTGGRAA
jgi:hypothetical protein